MTTTDDERLTVNIKIDVGTLLLAQAILEIERGEEVDEDEVTDRVLQAISYLETYRRKESECSNSSA